MDTHHYLIRRFCSKSTSTTTRWPVHTVPAFHIEYHLWCSDWLKLLREISSSPESSNLKAGTFFFFFCTSDKSVKSNIMQTTTLFLSLSLYIHDTKAHHPLLSIMLQLTCTERLTDYTSLIQNEALLLHNKTGPSETEKEKSTHTHTHTHTCTHTHTQACVCTERDSLSERERERVLEERKTDKNGLRKLLDHELVPGFYQPQQVRYVPGVMYKSRLTRTLTTLPPLCS